MAGQPVERGWRSDGRGMQSLPSPCGAAVTIESTSSRWDRASLPRRAREELDRLAADRPPALEGPMEPARDRLMRAEERAGAERRACIATGQAAHGYRRRSESSSAVVLRQGRSNSTSYLSSAASAVSRRA